MSGWRDALTGLSDAVADAELPAAIGELEAAKARLYARLYALGDGHANASPPRAYNAAQAAEMLSRNVSWVRRHPDALGAVKEDGALFFPEAGLRRFLERRR